MQRDQVQHRLQRVMRTAHLGFQRVVPVVPGCQLLARTAEPVRLVVDDEEPFASGPGPQPEHEVKAARQVTP